MSGEYFFFFPPAQEIWDCFRVCLSPPCSLPGKRVFIEEERKADRQDGREETEL